MVMTRKEYMDTPWTEDGKARADAFRKYHGQFVNARTIAAVVVFIGADKLRASTDPHLNDIPLKLWDACPLHLAMSLKEAGDYLTQAGHVCIVKEAARQWLDAQPKSECVHYGLTREEFASREVKSKKEL